MSLTNLPYSGNNNRIHRHKTTTRMIILNKQMPILMLIAVLLLVSGCGQSGDLYMPEDEAETSIIEQSDS